MSLKNQITVFLVSMMVMLSPILSLASVQFVNAHDDMMEMSCCAVDSEEEAHACCADDGQSEEKGSCDDNQSCPMNDCFIPIVNAFHVIFPQMELTEETPVFSEEKNIIDFTRSWLIQDHQKPIWNPPKYVS